MLLAHAKQAHYFTHAPGIHRILLWGHSKIQGQGTHNFRALIASFSAGTLKVQG